MKNEITPQDIKNKICCTKCGKVIKNGFFLELSETDGLYYFNRIPEGHVSQGSFPFGFDCAKTPNN